MKAFSKIVKEKLSQAETCAIFRHNLFFNVSYTLASSLIFYNSLSPRPYVCYFFLLAFTQLPLQRKKKIQWEGMGGGKALLGGTRVMMLHCWQTNKKITLHFLVNVFHCRIYILKKLKNKISYFFKIFIGSNEPTFGCGLGEKITFHTS